MDKSFYGRKRQTNSMTASRREGLIAPMTSSSLFFFSPFFHTLRCPASSLRVPFHWPDKAYKEASKTSKAFT